MTHSRKHPRLRLALALAALALVLHAAYLWPLPLRAAGAVPYTARGGGAPARELVQGDHLQLLYHFDLFDAYLHGDLPWFRNLWEFNTSDEARPPRPDLCYAPFALPYSLARRAGASDAFAWNLAQWLSVLLGLGFSFALARRHGAGTGAALAIAALAACLPYRWCVLAGGSPTGFGMGLVPGIALGADIAVRDRRARGGVLAGALAVACYAADLHCFLFAVLALPLWGLVALLRSPDNPFATRRRFLRLVRALSPIALGGVLCAVPALAAKRAYASTDAAGGRSLSDLARHSPDWHAFFDPDYFSHFPDQFHHGWAFAALFALAGLALLAATVLALVHLLRRRRTAPIASPSIVFHPAFSSRAEAPAARDTSALRAALAGLLLAASIVFALELALGTNGAADGLPLRAVRKLVPPFRMVRQPLKVLCLLPTLVTAFFALAWCGAFSLCAALRRLPASAALSRLASSQHMRAATPVRRSWVRRNLAGLGAAALVLVVFSSTHAGMHAGLCLLPGPDAAYGAAVADAAARGATARALVLPIWPGDSSWSSVYQYRAMRSGLRMLNGYAAVTEPDYVDNVFHRYESMTEGEISAAQLDALRALGVTAVILQEDAFPAKVSPFPFGHTLRRLLAHPALELLAHDGGTWAFRLLDADAADEKASKPDSATPAPTARNWRLKTPGTNASTWVYVSPENAKSARWIVRAEAGKELVLVAESKREDGSIECVTNRFPAVAGAAPDAWRSESVAALAPGPNRRSYLATPGEARISHVAFAPVEPVLRTDADGSVRIPLCELAHDFGTTVLDPATGRPCALRFTPRHDPPCVAVRGPFVPLPAGRYVLDKAPFIRYFDHAGKPYPRPWTPPVDILFPDGVRRRLAVGSADDALGRVFETDGTLPLDLEIHFDHRANLDWVLGDLVLRRLP